MRTLLSVFIGALFCFTTNAQVTTTSATFTAGHIETEFSTTATKDTSNESACFGTLNVGVPAGRYVVSVSVTYGGEALGSGWMSEQFSYLECATTGLKEKSISSGPPVNSAGVFVYNRANIDIANGVAPAGGLDFNLHAFRTFSTTPSCNTQVNRIKNNSWTVTVHHIPLPSCFRPNNVAVSNIQANSVDLSWTTGGASNWQIEYGPAGFTPGTGTLIPVSTNPFTLNGLSPQTVYEFRVRDSCGVGDVSIWTSMKSFQTGCSAVMAPWTENFDSGTWSAGPNFNSNGTIDTCWLRNWNNGFLMKTGPPVFSSNFTGPSGDHTTGSAKYIFSEAKTFGALPMVARIESPLVDLSALTVPELTFWYHMFGLNVDQLDVEISQNNGGTWTNIFNRTGQLQTAKTDPWKEVIVNLAAYANATVKLRFTVTQTNFGTNGDVAIDDVSIHEAPICPRPQNLEEIFIWTNRATLGWTTGGASNWQIEHGPPGFIPGTGTISSVSSNPGILGGLSPATSYDVYIRDSCGPGNVSLWQGPLRIKTRCAAFGTPYTRDFQGVAYSPGIFFNDTGTINSCWRRDNLINYVWKGGPPTFSPFNTGPDFDHTFGNSSGKYVFAQAIGGVVNSPNRVTNLQSSLINLTALTDPQLTFWYHMFGSDILSLQVRISTGNGVWNLERTISGQQQSAKSDPWNEVIIDLSAYTGDTIVVEFRARSLASGTASQIAIDDLNVGEAPSCPKSQNLVVTATTNNSITLNWLPGGTASFWNVEYGPVGFTPGNGTLLTATTQPFTIGSLSPNTAYDFYVRDSCGVGDVAVWTGPATDSTECNPVSAPWTENFEGTAFLPVPFAAGSIASCWNRTVTGNYIWTPGQGGTQSFGTGPDVDHTLGTSSGKFIYSEALFGVAQSISGWLETPLIDLTPLTVPEFSFWYHMFGAEIDSLVVEVSDGVSWNHEYSRVGQQQASNAAAWEEAILDLGSYAGDTIQIRFTAYKNGTFAQTVDIALDDLDIHEKPSCAKPSDLTVVGVSSGNVTLAWVTGGASDWQIEYGPNGFTPGSGTIINVNTNPFAITGLTPSTTYDFYVRDSCGVGDVSAWRGAVTTTTECLPTPAPWSEDFDGSDFIAAINFADTGTINTCWDRYPVTDYFWIPGPGPFLSIATGPSADHTSGSGKFMFTETNGFPPNLPFVTHLETPLIDLSPLSTPQLSFWYFMFGNAIGNLIVEVDNGSGYTSLQTISGAQQTSQSEPWLQSILDLSAYAGDTVQIRFKVSKSVNSTVSDVAIDDVVIDDNLLCDPPTALSIGGITTDSAEVNWNATTTGSNLVYYDQAAGPGSAVTLTDVTSPHILFGLNPNTTYVVMVFDSCAAPVFTSDTIADTISTLPCPVLISDFNYTSNELDVNFDGSLSTNADSLMWLYGDGNFASGTTSSHTYGAAGTYTVTLLSWSNCGLTDTLVQDIEVCDTLSASLASTDAFLTVNYDASASLNPDSLYWDFGDGNWSNAVQPVHNYAASGIYTVWLYTYNNCGVADSTTLNVQVCDTLLGSFSYVQDGDSVFFDGSASKGYNLLQWDFGDGTIGGAAVTSHIYSSSGTFTVTLTVQNECGDVQTVTQTIQMCQPAVPIWTYTIVGTTTAGMEVQFDASASLNASIYEWDFGDGSNVTGPVFPTHTYTIPSLTYRVTLTVRNNCGEKSSHGYRLSEIGLEEFDELHKVEVYPNPVDDKLLISWNPQYTSPEEVLLWSVQGKQLMKEVLEAENLEQGSLEWDLYGLPEGVYIINLRGMDLDIRESLLIQH